MQTRIIASSLWLFQCGVERRRYDGVASDACPTLLCVGVKDYHHEDWWPFSPAGRRMEGEGSVEDELWAAATGEEETVCLSHLAAIRMWASQSASVSKGECSDQGMGKGAADYGQTPSNAGGGARRRRDHHTIDLFFLNLKCL